MIMERNNDLNQQELDFFLKGNTSLEQQEEKNDFRWLDDSQFKDLIFLTNLSEKWKNLLSSIREDEIKWRLWFNANFPEETKPP